MDKETYFFLGIQVIKDEKGRAKAFSHTINFDVPEEFIVARLRAYLKHFEDKYYDEFNSDLS